MSLKEKKITSLIICFLLLLLLPIVFSKPTRNLDGTGTARALTVQQIRNKHGTREVILDNGIIRVSFSSPQGLITGIKYNGVDNVLSPHQRARGYWDITWQGGLDRIEGTKFKIITQNQEQVEISFSRTWESGSRSRSHHHIPLTVDKRYIIRKNTSGIYAYGIFERLPEWPEFDMGQVRIVFKLDQDKFHYMAVADEIQREMPTDGDRDIHRGHAKALGYKEAVQLTHPHNPMFKNQVDDKYQYSCEIKDNKVHGWISTKSHVGFWIISPSGEYRSGGPVKQELTSHTGPTAIASFISGHYLGTDMDVHYGEAWKKVLGPVFIYLNSGDDLLLELNHDLIYTIGASNYSQDWFYAHVTRNNGGSTYKPTTWQIVFHLPYVNMRGSYTLQLALASAARANLQVRFNNQYTTGYIGRDNAIARHGIHGIYRLYSINVPGRLLRTGTNTIYLRQAKASGPFEGLMYDYIRLEEPSRD
ncbi:PREDICTED: uncharacterized protein LOC109132906 [Camelina sativa]|uniref:Uncharacterized protein LOC109132906 n=1 Tax=Camelina sativa TaxID=90675 RepID=A0ABM1RPH7_CAMSA|nr:PREDICTED: uncharacterized protein LOC109132906 [Camelina sativa]